MSTARCVVDHGDKPRNALPGLRLCQHCRAQLGKDLEALPRLDLALELALIATGAMSQGDKITHRKDPGLVLNDVAATARTVIRHTLVANVRMVHEERGLHDWPGDNIPAMTAWLKAHLDWLAAHEIAGDIAGEHRALHRQARAAAYPNRVRRWELCPCIEADCPGILTVTIRSDDDLLPSAISCDHEAEHIWSSSQWLTLGRQLLKQGIQIA